IYDWHLEDMFDRVIFVYVNKNIQESRLSQRDNIDLEYAKKKINSQIDIDEKYQLAKSRKDYIVDNNGTIDALNPQIDEILKEIENEI
ncbi:MAG: dephospho-CoA kinase, partial [Bacilli bacterium]|nr:dephospho-CoA kinase [Bacilli bacterium]